MAKNYNIRRIRVNYSYSLKEIADLYGINIRTVRAWVKDGLEIIPDCFPYLVYGEDLQNYLKKKQDSKRVKLAPNEFYCVKCKKAVVPKDNTVKLHYKGTTIGKGIKDFLIIGICPDCLSQINRLSNDNKKNVIEATFKIEKEIKDERCAD